MPPVELREIRVDPRSSITSRQLELLALYASGFTLSEIGDIKFLSQYTVRNTLLTAQQRVGAKNLTHLCVICFDAGMIRKSGDRAYTPVQEERIIGD